MGRRRYRTPRSLIVPFSFTVDGRMMWDLDLSRVPKEHHRGLARALREAAELIERPGPQVHTTSGGRLVRSARERMILGLALERGVSTDDPEPKQKKRRGRKAKR